jgi:hypothetical protein
MPSLKPEGIQHEHILTYNQERDRWEGGSRERFLWMDNATFLLYVDAYLEFHWMKQPTPEQVSGAIQHCAHLAYWNGCERFYDRRVHIQRLTADESQIGGPSCFSSPA